MLKTAHLSPREDQGQPDMLTLDHKPWEHQWAHFHVIKPQGSVEPIPDCSPSVGSTWKSLQGAASQSPGRNPSPGRMLVPTAGLLEGGGVWGAGNQASHARPFRPGRTRSRHNPTGHQLYRQRNPTPQTDTQGVMPRKLNPSLFQFSCWFCCSEKEEKRSDFFPLFPFLRTKIKRTVSSRSEHS